MQHSANQTVVVLNGRIDGLTAPEVRRKLDEASTMAVNLLVDMRGVTYLSSAGLRVFMQIRKDLKQAGGGITMIETPSCVAEVLKVSGLYQYFCSESLAVSDPSDVSPPAGVPRKVTFQEGGYDISLETFPVPAGILDGFGNPGKMASASFGEADVMQIPLGRYTWGAGIGASGGAYNDYRGLFGESLILNGHFFSYPAVRRPSVDYSFLNEGSGNPINFLYGFGIQGDFAALGSFSMEGATTSLEGLFPVLSRILALPGFAVVIAGQSGGLLGMHLRRSPALGLIKGDSVFDPDQFPAWFAFPAEPEDFHTTVVVTGFYDTRGSLSPFHAGHLLPPDSGVHLHALVMERGLVNFDPGGLTTETERILRNFEPIRVVHLLPASRIIKGIIGIIPLP